MTAGDGNYITLANLKTYLLGNIAGTDPTKYNANVSVTPDDDVLTWAIARAESKFESETGTTYYHDSGGLTSVEPIQTFVDGYGWLHLFARERGPVSSVTAVSVRDLINQTSWQTLAWATDGIILPPATSPPRASSWHVRILPTTYIPSRSTGQILAKWSYNGGYSTIPDSLKGIILRLAGWIFKLREAPLGVVKNPMLGIVDVPQRIPPDIQRDVELWRPVYS